jgi:CRP/FNR family cyclic AMP-dependent transcriptional regulator
MVDSSYLKENQYLIKKLMRIPALKSFTEEYVQKILEMSKVKVFKTGDLIFEEGSYANLIYYLISGQAKVVKDGKKLVVLQRTGDVFGEMGPIDGSSRSASVYAEDETVCIEIDFSQLEKGPEKDMHAFRYIVFRGFAEILANRLRVTTEELIHARKEIDELRLLVE